MRFSSDNNAPAHPAVLEAILAANDADNGYDGDALSAKLDAAFSDVFDTKVSALWISTGTAANGLALAALSPPYGGILCHADSHINADEAGAPEFYTHGGKLLDIARREGDQAKLTVASVTARMNMIANDVHRVQPTAISITNAAEDGCVYTPDDTRAIGALAQERGLGFHLDGARFANAVAHLGCSPADLSWRAGVDMMSFGFIKNGGMSTEALICFKPEHVHATRIRRKRAGHLFSKGRFQAAQLLALLKDDLWLTNARLANQGAQRIAKAAGDRLICPVEANEVFLRVTAADVADFKARGFLFYEWEDDIARFVISWSQPESDVDALVAAIQAQALNPVR